MNVISLDRARARLRAQRRIEPPSALGMATRPAAREVQADDGEDRVRMRQNIAAAAVILLIVGLGSWLISSLHYYSQLQACVEAGHRNCLRLEAKYLPSPYWR